jgi:hypothetical protein
MSLSKPIESNGTLEMLRDHVFRNKVRQAVMLTTAAFFQDDPEDEKRPAQRRRVYTRPEYDSSTWARDYLFNPDVKQPGTRTARDFRRGFRVPYPLFLQLVDLVRAKGWFTDGAADLAGRPCPSLELKVLPVVLYVVDCVCR